MPGKRKPPENRQDKSPGRALVPAETLGEPASAHPTPPRGHWQASTRRDWVQLWSADVSAAYARHHLPLLYRLFEIRDLRDQAMRLYRAAPMVDGSQGQPVSNPALGAADKLERQCVVLEDRLGLSPKAQAALGIAIGQQQLTVAELNRQAARQVGDDVSAEWDEA